MNKPSTELYSILYKKYGSDSAIAEHFNVERPTVFPWRRAAPEKIALLCHLSAEIPYTYNPSDYGRDPNNLKLALTKPER